MPRHGRGHTLELRGNRYRSESIEDVWSLVLVTVVLDGA
jgi:hypothetical protein